MMDSFDNVDYGYYESGEELTETYTPIEIYSDLTSESEYTETTTAIQNVVEKDISDIRDGVQGILTFLFLAFVFLTIYFFYKVLKWFV